MKNALILFSLLSAFIYSDMAICADAPQYIVEMPGLKKEQIFSSAKSWIAQTFVSAKAVIQEEDKEAGRISGNGRLAYPCSGLSCIGREGWLLGMTMRIESKDEKMRVTYTNLMTVFPPSDNPFVPPETPVRDGDMDEVKPVLENLLQKLKESILKDRESSNW